MKHIGGPGLVFIRLITAMTMVIGAMSTAWAAPTDLIFLVSADTPVSWQTEDDIRNIYLGKKRVAGGFPVYPVDQSETEPIKLAFLEQVLHMTHVQYREQLLRRRFQDGAVTPRFVANSEETLKAVREAPGAIGYVYESEVGTMLGLKIVGTISTQ